MTKPAIDINEMIAANCHPDFMAGMVQFASAKGLTHDLLGELEGCDFSEPDQQSLLYEHGVVEWYFDNGEPLVHILTELASLPESDSNETSQTTDEPC
jgi:hypothetical protein